MNTVASAFHGANTLLHACFAQPGEEMLRCTSPGSRPIQYIVDRWPTGYETCVCCTSLGRAVVPEVKYSNRVSSALVTPSGAKAADACRESAEASQPSTASPTAIRVKSPGTSANL